LYSAFDLWLAKHFPDLQFERYGDDGGVHCKSEWRAQQVRDAITRRLAQGGLEVHPDKTRIVYCKDEYRRATSANERVDFLGYTFRPRLSKSKLGKHLVNCSPAVSGDALKEMGSELGSWRLNCRSDKSLGDRARLFNRWCKAGSTIPDASTSPRCIPCSDA
jgi:RNA-directed DNA polymerase